MSNRAEREIIRNGSLHKYALIGALGAYLLFLLVTNLIVVPYPQDNDLDEIGWIAAHQSLSRLESFANQNYPFGYPLLLRALTPIVGSLLTAALTCSTIAATASVLFVFLLTRLLYKSDGVAAAAAATAGIMLLSLATSEFADNLTTALVLSGIYAVVKRPLASAPTLWFGASAGLCYLFRFHYVWFLVIGPAGLLLTDGSMSARLRMIVLFLAGFLGSAFPLLIINTAVYGQPLHVGFMPYALGFFATGTLDWDNFLATYNLWPLDRLLLENPTALVHLLLENGLTLLERSEVAGGLLLVPLTVFWALPPGQRRSGRFIAAVLVLYIAAVILPSRFTARAFGPATCMLSVLSFPGLARVAGLLPAGFFVGQLPVLRAAWMTTAIVLLCWSSPIPPLLEKRETLLWNRAVLETMRAQGWKPHDKVFCSFWNFYNLDDPRFITFHNYGGYMLLDPLYNAEMPRPDAQSSAEWEAFLDRYGIRFVIADSNPKLQDFLERRDVLRWSEIYHDSMIIVLKRLT